MINLFHVAVLTTTVLLFSVSNGAVVPEQIHLALTQNRSEMNVAWTTIGAGSPTRLKYGLSQTKMTYFPVSSQPDAWTFGEITRYEHTVTLTGLSPDTQYYYQIDGSSKIYHFRTFPTDPRDLSICIFGDLGLTGVDFKGDGQSIQSLLNQAAKGRFHMVIHIGDIAYDLQSDKGRVGDGYMNKLEPLMATMPYMVIAGNHEEDGLNFTNYKKRFHMPGGSGDSMFYSFDLGPIHFVGINTENYGFFYLYGMDSVFTQYNWLENDLKNVDRSKTPWVISYQHRPFYCSNVNSGECTGIENRMIRTGFLNMPGFEDLLAKYKMDLGFWGHEHSYERFYPIADQMYYSDNDPYSNPDGPVYIISGSAGCHSGYAKFTDTPLPFSAKRINDYGYSILTLKNRTHLYIEQISIEKNDAVVDSLWISKTPSNRVKSRMRKGHPLPASVLHYSECLPLDVACMKRQLKRTNTEL